MVLLQLSDHMLENSALGDVRPLCVILVPILKLLVDGKLIRTAVMRGFYIVLLAGYGVPGVSFPSNTW